MINCAQILAWSAWAPGLADRAAWLAALRTHGADFGLLSNEYAPLNAAEPKAPAVLVPPMLRRRLSHLGRAAAEAAAPLLAAAEDKNLPWDYASRWGDLQLAVDSLESVAAGGTVSPAAFSTSVHNAPPALLSIALGHTGNLTALAGGPFSLEAAFESAVGLLFEAPQVLLICADLKPPVQTNAAGVTHAVGLLLGRQHETADPNQWREVCAKGPCAALTTRPLSASETSDNRLDTLAPHRHWKYWPGCSAQTIVLLRILTAMRRTFGQKPADLKPRRGTHNECSFHACLPPPSAPSFSSGLYCFRFCALWPGRNSLRLFPHALAQDGGRHA